MINEKYHSKFFEDIKARFFNRLNGYNGRQIRGVAQPGSAPALGAGSRRFKSSRPDQ